MSEVLTLKLDIRDGLYEGPLDLLLHLIDKNKVDLNDIPMSIITAQYMEYLELMEQMNLDAAGDFLVMAATLANIKSRLLLPRLPAESGAETEDPRMELTGPLLEYAQLKGVARILDDRPVLNRDVFTRGEPGGLEELADCQAAGRGIESTIYDLIEAWHQLSVRRESEDTSLNFRLETKTIGQKLAEIRQFLMEMKSAHFRDLAAYAVSTLEVALSFLAVLELARVGFLRLWQETETDSSGPRLWLADPEASPLEPGQLDYR